MRDYRRHSGATRPGLCSHKGELLRVGIIPGRHAPALLAHRVATVTIYCASSCCAASRGGTSKRSISVVNSASSDGLA